MRSKRCQTVELDRNRQHTNNSLKSSEEHKSLSPEVRQRPHETRGFHPFAIRPLQGSIEPIGQLAARRHRPKTLAICSSLSSRFFEPVSSRLARFQTPKSLSASRLSAFGFRQTCRGGWSPIARGDLRPTALEARLKPSEHPSSPRSSEEPSHGQEECTFRNRCELLWLDCGSRRGCKPNPSRHLQHTPGFGEPVNVPSNPRRTPKSSLENRRMASGLN